MSAPYMAAVPNRRTLVIPGGGGGANIHSAWATNMMMSVSNISHWGASKQHEPLYRPQIIGMYNKDTHKRTPKLQKQPFKQPMWNCPEDTRHQRPRSIPESSLMTKLPSEGRMGYIPLWVDRVDHRIWYMALILWLI